MGTMGQGYQAVSLCRAELNDKETVVTLLPLWLYRASRPHFMSLIYILDSAHRVWGMQVDTKLT